VGRPSGEFGGSVVKKSKGKFIDLVKNTYRVLLSRGLKGCYVYFLDRDTEKFFRSRMDVAGAKVQEAKKEVELYVNALPLVSLADLEDLNSSKWRARLEEGWTGESCRVSGGPFLRDRFLVRADDASMEPSIPKGAICEFRLPSEESLENKIVLAGIKTYAKMTPAAVIKKYQRLSVIRAGEVAEMTKILLVSENKAFPSLELRDGVDSIEILGVLNQILS